MHSIILETTSDENFLFKLDNKVIELTQKDKEKIQQSHLFWKTLWIVLEILNIKTQQTSIVKITSHNLYFENLPVVLVRDNKVNFTIKEKLEIITEFYNSVWMQINGDVEKITKEITISFNEYCKKIH